MPSRVPSSPRPEPPTHIASAASKQIEEQVIRLLGRPPNVLGVQVRKLWCDRHRANVFVGPNIASATIIRSFFLVVDGTGKITESIPAIA
jgi:hypothetical protein